MSPTIGKALGTIIASDGSLPWLSGVGGKESPSTAVDGKNNEAITILWLRKELIARSRALLVCSGWDLSIISYQGHNCLDRPSCGSFFHKGRNLKQTARHDIPCCFSIYVHS